jgi:CDP-diacylglycerol--glycerol-3-phosphate 3-phosphatidyltransferase
MRDLSADSWPWYARVSGGLAVLVVGREMLVTALRGFIEQQGGDFSAMMAGKLKMVFQCAAVIASLLALRQEPGVAPAWLLWSLVVTIWLSVLSTVYSGVGYIFTAVKMVRN